MSAGAGATGGGGSGEGVDDDWAAELAAFEAEAAAGLADAAIEASVLRFREVEQGAFDSISTSLREILGRPPRSFASYAREHAHHW